MMEATPTRSTNVHANLRAGRYWYVDHPGSAPQLVDVTYELGLPVARFQDMEPEDAGLELDPRDFSGEFRPIG